MAQFDDLLDSVYAVNRMVRRGTMPSFSKQELLVPAETVLRGARNKDQAMDTYRFLSESFDPEIVPALTIARGQLGDESAAMLRGIAEVPQEFPDFAKDIHNLAAGADPAAIRALYETDQAPDSLAQYIDSVGGLYTADRAKRIKAASGKFEPSVLDYFDNAEDIPGVSAAIKEASLRALAQQGVSPEDLITLYRNPQLLAGFPGRTRGILSFTRTPEQMADQYNMKLEDFVPYSVRAGDIMTDVPSLAPVRYNPGWVGENEMQTFSDLARRMQ